jgi:purine-binding chemotaxis protein CheW
VEPRPAFGARIRTDFIAGILNHSEQFIVILDIQQVLSVSEIAELIGVSVQPE